MLLDALLKFAQEMVRKRGGFLPFGNSMTASREIRAVMGYTGSEHPPAQELIDLMVEGMRADAAGGAIRAAGLCYEVTLRDESGSIGDAIGVSLEHRAGDSVEVRMPFTKSRLRGLRFGDLIAAPGAKRISDSEGPRSA